MSLDIRIKCGWADHPKTERLARRCGPDAPRCLVRLWCWAREHRPAGVLSGMDEEAVEIAAGWRGEPGALGAALVEIGWVDEVETCLTLHEWAEHETWAAASAERSEAARLAGIASGVSRRAKATEKRTDCERSVQAPFNSVHDPLNGMRTESNGGRTPSPSPSPENPESHQNGIPPGLAASAEAPTTTRPVEGSRGAIGPARVIDAWNAVAKEQRWRTSSSAESSVKKVRAALARREFREAWEADLSLLRSRGLPFVGQPGEHQNWRPSLEWFVRPDTHAAIVDGRYWTTSAPAAREPEISREVLALRAAQKGGAA